MTSRSGSRSAGVAGWGVWPGFPGAHPVASACHLEVVNIGVVMPKMKTKKGAAKRFRIRASGSIKRGQAFKRHILTKKTTKNKRQLRGSVQVHESDTISVRAMMPYA
jgi:large subunit ribosomal protein L35